MSDTRADRPGRSIPCPSCGGSGEPCMTCRAFGWIDSPDSTGAELIAAERIRQVGAEGWTPEHDDQHTKGELIMAAEAYAYCTVPDVHDDAADAWPWEREGFKPSDDPVRNLVKAGALIAAEIDRLRRAENREPSDG